MACRRSLLPLLVLAACGRLRGATRGCAPPRAGVLQSEPAGSGGLWVENSAAKGPLAQRSCFVLALRGGAPAAHAGARAKSRRSAGASKAAPEAPPEAVPDVDPDDALAGTMPYYPPGALPDWAQEIAEWRNMTMAEKVA